MSLLSMEPTAGVLRNTKGRMGLFVVWKKFVAKWDYIPMVPRNCDFLLGNIYIYR